MAESKDTARLVLWTNWPLANLLTLRCHQVKKGLKVETLIWGTAGVKASSGLLPVGVTRNIGQ